MKTRVIIDTDPGVDDALALLLALSSPELRVEAVTTVGGNAALDQVTKNAWFLLDFFDFKPRPILAKGASPPRSDTLIAAEPIHGSDGLGGLDRFANLDGRLRYPRADPGHDVPHATEVLLDLLTRYPDELTLITLGPLTNLAEALVIDPMRVRLLREVVIMGGAIRVPGNITPAAEFNISADPYAAQRVFRSGLRITLVPLDVTEKVFLDSQEALSLGRRIGEPIGRFLLDSTSKAMEHMKGVRGIAAIHLHDPLAVGVAIKPSLVKTIPLNVAVETQGGVTHGMTLADLRPIRDDLKQPPNLHAALEVDREGFLQLFTERLCHGSW